jgi:hypothetical protein
MCCIFTVLVFLGPRFAILLWWLYEPLRFEATFGGNWVLPLLCFIFLPWTLLWYLVVAPFGATTAGPDIQGFDWVWLGLGLVTDLLSYAGGAYGNRRQIYDYVPAAESSSIAPYSPPPPPPSTPSSEASSSGTSGSGTGSGSS